MTVETTTSQSHDAPVAGDPRTNRGQILVINSNGTYRLVGHGNEPLGLPLMQGLVGGYIERVSTPNFDLWVNEEGLLRDDFDPNVGASWLLNRHGAPGYTIVGPAFVAANNGEEAIPAEPLVIAAAITLLEELGYEPQDPDPMPPTAGGSGAEDSVFAEHTDLVEYFQELDPTAIDQSNGNFYTKADQFQPCCVGAHIAYVLDTFRYLVGDPAEHCSFTEGYSTLASDLNLSTSQLDWLLHAAGASADPFSSQLWPVPADVVFTNLLGIEAVPDDFEHAERMHDEAVAAYTASLPPIAGGSGEEEVPARWSTADQAQRREALHFQHCATCEEGSLARCAVGLRLATVTDAALVAAMGDRPAAVAGGSGEEDSPWAACIPVLAYFEQLPPGAIDQENGGYRPNEHFEPCCVGAHLAYFLGTELLHPETPTRSYHSFMDGQQAFRKFLNVDHADMLNLLWAAGAHHSPFSNQAWPVPAAAVFRNLLAIETVPTFDEAQELHEQAVQDYAAAHPPIAGGCDAFDEPIYHDYRVTVRENMTEDRDWVLNATDPEDARTRYSEGEDVDSRIVATHSIEVHDVKHETDFCDGCFEEQRRGITHRPSTIAGGSGEDPVGDAILAVRQLLADEDHWTRGAPYRNSEGSACQVQNATSYCLTGAIYLSSTSPGVRRDVYRRLMRAMPKRFEEVSLVAFNDGAGRTHADILELLDAATRPPIAGGSGEDIVGDAILAMRQLLAKPEHWTKAAPARTKEGYSCSPTIPAADDQAPYSYCLTGALDVVSHGKPQGTYSRIYDRLMAALREHNGADWSLIGYNDHVDTDHEDILAILDIAKPRPPIGGGSIEAGCIGRSRCIVQKQYEWCWAHDPACHAAFCHCIDSTPATEAAYEEQLRQEVRRPALPAATPPAAVATVDHEYAGTDAWLRSLINGTGSQEDNDAITAKRVALRREWETEHAKVCPGCDSRICTAGLVPIAGGSGEDEPLPFVAPTDSQDEAPPMHHFHVETRELLATDRTWFVTARSEEAIKQDDGFNWEELMKEENEELIEKQVHQIEHDSDCPACQGATPGIRWSGTELPPIADGAVGTPKLRWEAKGRGGGKEYHAGKYVIFHPYDEAHLKSGRGGILISKKWRLNFEDRHWDRKEHQWVGEEETLGTYATVQEAKRAAQIHADSLVDHQPTLTPIAGGSGELEVEVTVQCTFTKTVTITPDDYPHDVIAAAADQAFFDAFYECTDLAKDDIDHEFADAEYHYNPPYPPIAGGSGAEEPRFARCWPVAAYFAALPEEAWSQVKGAYIPERFRPCCVGAHLAFFLGTRLHRMANRESYHDYMEGAEAFATRLGLTIAQVDRLLFAAGAGIDPFGYKEWPTPPAAVFATLLTMEDVPASIQQAQVLHDQAVTRYEESQRLATYPPIAGGSGEEEPVLDDIARDHVAMDTVEVEDIKTCLHCQASVLPWQLQCQGCGSSTPFTPPEPPRWFCTDYGLDDHESEDAAELCCRPPIAGGSGEDPPPRRRLTTRERRTNRMRHREEWADSRARKKDNAIATWEQRRQEVPPMGEPIKIGHHSEGRHRRAIQRVDQALDKVVEHDAMLGKHERAAGAIARELERSIYDDDIDAIGRLQERIAALEAKRTRMKAINAWLTKHGGIPRRRVPRGSASELYAQAKDALQRCKEAMALTEEECRRLPDMLLYSETLGYPPYALSNLSGNIRRQVKRKERLEREAADAAQS